MPEDESRYKLVEGELRKMAPTGGLHGYLALRIASRLERYVDANNPGRTCAAGPCFRLSSNPDTHSQVIEKPLAWLESGSRMGPVVDPEKLTGPDPTLTADTGDVIYGDDVVPGWRLPVAELFA